jgi:deoxyribonuclease V
VDGVRHRWDLTPAEARALQETLRAQARYEPLDLGQVRLVAGCDVSYNRFSPDLYVGVVVLSWPDLTVVERVGLRAQASLPNVPGLLSFRELPPLLAAWERLRARPDVLLCDGHGLAHPRRCGLACHAGLWLDLPTIGCAKSLLLGTADTPADEPGAGAPVVDGQETIGWALRTRAGARPVYVSVGHRCRLEDAVALVVAAGQGYRLPDPTRLAHGFVNELRGGASVLACESRGLPDHLDE